MIYSETIKYLMLQRQGFVPQVKRIHYNDLFRLMSPVQTQYWTRPGNPPELACRAAFPEYPHVFAMRNQRIIVKGRFQGGNVAYVFADELPLFAAVYSKDRETLSYDEISLLELLEQEGPMTIGTMKELTGRLAKQITPVLHRLQQKFLVFEDQADDEWDRAWYLFETEFPETDLTRYTRNEALKELILRFSFLNVCIDADMLASFYKLKQAEFKQPLKELEEEGVLKRQVIDGIPWYLKCEDIPLLNREILPARSVFALHRNDFLVKSHENTLSRQFTHSEYQVLFYLLIDGEFCGFAAGFFKNGPFVIEDIILNLDDKAAESRKGEILEALGRSIDTELSPAKRYCGQKNI